MNCGRRWLARSIARINAARETEGLEAEAVKQMADAGALPVEVTGALMPDAHVGYGLPIGGALATDNAVIPYVAVDVDVACRMKLTVYDRKANAIAASEIFCKTSQTPKQQRKQVNQTKRCRD